MLWWGVGSVSEKVETKETGKKKKNRLRDRHSENGRERSKNSIFFFSPPDTRLCSSRPCAGNATCTETGEGGYLCICPPGYTGENCDLKRGVCITNGYQHFYSDFLFQENDGSSVILYRQPYLHVFIIRRNDQYMVPCLSVLSVLPKTLSENTPVCG